MAKKKLKQFGGGSDDASKPLFGDDRATGRMIYAADLLPDEKQILDELGVDYGRGISADGLSALFEAAGVSSLRQLGASATPLPNLPSGVDPAKIVKQSASPVSAISQDKVRQLIKDLNDQTKEDLNKATERARVEASGMNPNVVEAVRLSKETAMKSEHHAMVSPDSSSVSLEEKFRAIEPSVSAAQNTDDEFADMEDDNKSSYNPKREEKASTTEKPAEKDSEASSATCERCGWKKGEPFVVECSEQDKHDFVLAMGLGQDFVKRYSLLGGKMKLALRTLPMSEVRKCIQSAGEDAEGKTAVEQIADGQVRLTNYLLSLQLYEISTEDGVLDLPRSLEGWAQILKLPNDNLIPMQQVWEYVENTIIRTFPRYQIILGKRDEFERLTNLLQTKAGDTDFYNPASG